MEKVLWYSINKKQNELKQSKNDKSSTLPCNAKPYTNNFSATSFEAKFVNW